MAKATHPSIVKRWCQTQSWFRELWEQLSPWGRAYHRFITPQSEVEPCPWEALIYLKSWYIDPIHESEEIEQLLRLLRALQVEALQIEQLRRIRNGLLWSPFSDSKYSRLASLIDGVIAQLLLYRSYAQMCSIQLPPTGIVPELINVTVLNLSILHLRSLRKDDPKRRDANEMARCFRRVHLWSIVPTVGNIRQLLNP